MVKQLWVPIAIAIAMVVTVFLPADFAIAADEESNDEWVLDEVIVTAQRREQKAMEIPISITVLSGDELEEMRITGFDDMATQVPNLTFLNKDDMKYSVPIIRGVFGNVLSAGGIDQPAAVYIDEVYLNSSVAQQFDLYEIERIEVLRGPQGTLYGRNTVAGVISVTTKKATDVKEGYFEASYGDYNAKRFRGSISGPVIEDKLFGKLSAVYSDREGYEEDFITGVDLNAKHHQGIRGDLRYEASDDVTVTLLADYRNVDQDARAMEVGGYNEDPATAFIGQTGPGFIYQGSAIHGLLGMLIPGYTFNGLARVDTDPYDRRVAVSTAGEEKLDAWGLALIADVRLENMDFKSITSYRSHDFSQFYDVDNTEVDLTTQGAPESVDAFMQELRLTSNNGGKFDWITGLFVYHQKSTSEFDIVINNPFENPDLLPFGSAIELMFAALNVLPLGVLSSAEYGLTHTEGKVTLDSYAAFAHANYHFTDNLYLALGGRYTYEKKSVDYFQTSPFGNILFGLENIPRQKNSDSWDAFTPTVKLDYSFNPDVHAYASISNGFKSGGFSDIIGSLPDQSFKQETTWNYEIGMKATLMDQRVQLSLAAFQLDWQDQQQTLRLPPKEGGVGVVDILKESTVGDIETTGIEMEIAAAPFQGLILWGGLGILDSEYTKVTDEAAEQAGLQPGDKIAAVPDWSLSFGARYSLNLKSGAQAFIGVNGEYRDDVLIDSNVPNVDAVQEGYALINTQIGLITADDRWQATLWAKNIGDEEYITFQTATALDNFNYQALTNRLGAPRTYGVDVRLNF